MIHFGIVCYENVHPVHIRGDCRFNLPPGIIDSRSGTQLRCPPDRVCSSHPIRIVRVSYYFPSGMVLTLQNFQEKQEKGITWRRFPRFCDSRWLHPLPSLGLEDLGRWSDVLLLAYHNGAYVAKKREWGRGRGKGKEWERFWGKKKKRKRVSRTRVRVAATRTRGEISRFYWEGKKPVVWEGL